ncbi:unnamed protein product [Rotaria socialis]|uniref:Uncharacterized protein n=1 Tax=Rotaria socialis TaxID=392032 RepID=A0A817X4Y7_9BILA|nr:unnamed protein product [Rotaria socialis]CAF4829493.1 unnamed protein product [Rotaria socialis]
MCYLLPFHALSKIPNCRRPPKAPMNTTARLKRFVTGIIAIGIGSAALAMATANSIQIRQLNQEIITITNSLTTLDAITTTHTTQLLQLQAGQLKLAVALNNTQFALNQTIDLVNRHDINIDNIAIFAKNLNNRLTSFIHSVETHFLHTSLSDIFPIVLIFISFIIAI